MHAHHCMTCSPAMTHKGAASLAGRCLLLAVTDDGIPCVTALLGVREAL
jgi:hypothetical protein